MRRFVMVAAYSSGGMREMIGYGVFGSFHAYGQKNMQRPLRIGATCTLTTIGYGVFGLFFITLDGC